ncbi:hypothetical protein [Streptomyces sp. NPDC002463]|uniref:hypothetical protein n=1 Tax=Streptomyces sp. NPDC002463 TaxID=3364645 RepID=UPI0036BDAA49
MTVTAGIAVQVGAVASVRNSLSVAVIVRVGEGGELLPRVTHLRCGDTYAQLAAGACVGGTLGDRTA